MFSLNLYVSRITFASPFKPSLTRLTDAFSLDMDPKLARIEDTDKWGTIPCIRKRGWLTKDVGLGY